jgi:hypothetical protein
MESSAQARGFGSDAGECDVTGQRFDSTLLAGRAPGGYPPLMITIEYCNS